MGTLTVRWLGRGGQGSFTVARLLGVAATMDGQHALAFPSFGPERRGAPVSGFTKVSPFPIRDRSEIRIPDFFVVLDETLLTPALWSSLKPETKLIVNAVSSSHLDLPPGRDVHCLDAASLAEEYLGKPIVNTAMLGGLVAISNIVSTDAVRLALLQEIKPEYRCQNIRLFDAAYHRFSHDFVI